MCINSTKSYRITPSVLCQRKLSKYHVIKQIHTKTNMLLLFKRCHYLAKSIFDYGKYIPIKLENSHEIYTEYR